MRSRRSFLKLSAGLLASTFLVQGCTRTPQATETPLAVTPSPDAMIEERPLRIAIPGTPKRFDPAFYTVIEEYQLGFAIFDGLVWVDETLTPQPMLAEAWESSQDLTEWTFKLRENVQFHHGTPMTAEDVVYTFTRILDPTINSSLRSTLSFISAIEAINDYTIRFVLQGASAEFPVLVGAPQAQIMARDYDYQTFDTHPSGTGPFQFVRGRQGEYVYLKRNPNYWQIDQPQLEALEFLFVPYEEQITALRNGTVDMMMQVGMKDIAQLASYEEIKVAQTTSGAYQSIVMRATAKPFEDVRVREALKYCVDRHALQREQLEYHGEIGNDHPVASINAYHADLPNRPYDPDAARALLAAAGHPNGLQLDLITSTVRPGMVELALSLQQSARFAGIEIEVIRVPPQVYWSDYAGRVPFHTSNWGFRPSIDETFMAAYHSQSKGNESHWRNPKMDGLLDQARGESDPETRQTLYYQAQETLHEEGAVIIPYFTPTATAMRHNFDGFKIHPSGWLNFRETRFT